MRGWLCAAGACGQCAPAALIWRHRAAAQLLIWPRFHGLLTVCMAGSPDHPRGHTSDRRGVGLPQGRPLARRQRRGRRLALRRDQELRCSRCARSAAQGCPAPSALSQRARRSNLATSGHTRGSVTEIRRAPSARVQFVVQKKAPRSEDLRASLFESLAVTYSGMPKRHTTIGAERLHFRVRNGIGWFPLAMAARQTVRGS